MKTVQISIALLVIILCTDITFAYGPYQGAWRWRNDNGTVYTATWKDSVRTSIVLTENENLRLRIENSYSNSRSGYISLWYTQDAYNGPWIPITSADTGKFFISPSDYLMDTMSYFDNKLLPFNSPDYTYIRTITFDSTDNYFMNSPSYSLYELEYSIKPTSNIEPGSAYFFLLACDSLLMTSSFAWDSDYPTLLTNPVSWIPQSSGTPSGFQDVCFTDENNGTVVGNNTIIRTTNGGVDWFPQLIDTTSYFSAVYFVDVNTGWVVGTGGKILKTTNGGIDWFPQLIDTLNSSFSDVYFVNVNTGWVVGSAGRILKTTNGGAAWDPQSSGTTWDLKGVYFTDADTGWVVGSAGSILKTTNGGVTWDPQWSGITVSLNGVYFTDANNGTAVGEDNFNNGKIIRTTNGGTTWDQVTGVPNISILNSVYFTNTNIGWAVGYYGIILKTTDSGLNWIKLVSGFSGLLSSVHFINSEIGWVVGGYGTILHSTNGGVSFVEEEQTDEIPSTYFLSNNYPNPFNPSTKIQYSIPQSGNVVIKVYDILGSEIETLVNEEKPSGTYELTWYAANLPSGVYFYQLRAGSFVGTKKMLLLK